MVPEQELLNAIQVVTGSLLTGIAIIVALLVRMLFKQVEAFLIAKIGEVNLNRLKSFTHTVVRDLEQNGAFKFFDGTEKKRMAKIRINQFCQENNLPYDSAFIDMTIEEIVSVMNEGLGFDRLISSELITGELPEEEAD